MNDKAGKAKPKKVIATDAETKQLVIQNRPIMSRPTSLDDSADSSEQKQEEPSTAPTLPSQSKRTVVVPVSTTEKKPEPSKVAQPASPVPSDAAPVPKDAKARPVEATTNDEEAEEAEETGEGGDKKDTKPSAETQKALEEAAAATKRELELEEFIDSRQFFVPINAVARKRSLKHSALLTVVVFLLALILVDLMLDSGLILLVQRIPHTHFFSTGGM